MDRKQKRKTMDAGICEFCGKDDLILYEFPQSGQPSLAICEQCYDAGHQQQEKPPAPSADAVMAQSGTMSGPTPHLEGTMSGPVLVGTVPPADAEITTREELDKIVFGIGTEPLWHDAGVARAIEAVNRMARTIRILKGWAER